MKSLYISLLSVLYLCGCSTASYIKEDFYRSSDTKDKLIPATVCVYKPTKRFVARWDKQRVGIYHWDEVIKEILSTRYRTVITYDGKSQCDYFVPSHFDLWVNPELRMYSGEMGFSITDAKNNEWGTFIVNPHHKAIDAPKSSSAKQLFKGYTEVALHDLSSTLEYKFKRNLRDNGFINGASIDLLSPFYTQAHTASRIMPNWKLGITYLTDDFFNANAPSEIMKRFDKKKFEDGSALIARWENNKFSKQAQNGQEKFLVFRALSIEPAYKQDWVRISFLKGDHATIKRLLGQKGDSWLSLRRSIEAQSHGRIAEKRLPKFENGDTIAVRYIVGDDSSTKLFETWLEDEANELKKYAIRYLAGYNVPTNPTEKERWDLAKLILGKALVAEKTEKLNKCTLDNPNHSKEKLLELFEVCTNKAMKIDFRKEVSDQQGRKMLRNLDQKLQNLKDNNPIL